MPDRACIVAPGRQRGAFAAEPSRLTMSNPIGLRGVGMGPKGVGYRGCLYLLRLQHRQLSRYAKSIIRLWLLDFRWRPLSLSRWLIPDVIQSIHDV